MADIQMVPRNSMEQLDKPELGDGRADGIKKKSKAVMLVVMFLILGAVGIATVSKTVSETVPETAQETEAVAQGPPDCIAGQFEELGEGAGMLELIGLLCSDDLVTTTCDEADLAAIAEHKESCDQIAELEETEAVAQGPPDCVAGQFEELGEGAGMSELTGLLCGDDLVTTSCDEADLAAIAEEKESCDLTTLAKTDKGLNRYAHLAAYHVGRNSAPGLAYRGFEHVKNTPAQLSRAWSFGGSVFGGMFG
jgi:hypothetical protein